MTTDDDVPPPARGRKITGAEARRIADEVLRENEQRRLPPADDRPCSDCGRPFRPTHDIESPGPTSRHPFFPVPLGRTPAGYDPDGTPYYPTTVGQLGLCGPPSDDTSVGPDASRRTRPAEAADPHPWEAEAALPGEWAEVERDAQEWRERASEPALIAAARLVLAEWSRMHPSGYLAMYPAMDALRAAVAGE